MSSAYLTHIPRKFVRATAGFPPSGRGDYFIPRAQVQPPEALVRKVWPWVDEWIAWFQQNENDVREEDGQLDGRDEGDRNDLAGKAFLRLLDYLRTVLLQDSVLLQDEAPHHPIFQDPIFSDQEYLDFVRVMKQALAVEIPQPQELLVRQAVPAIAEHMIAMENNLTQMLGEMHSILHGEQVRQRTVLEDVFSGTTPIFLNINHSLLPQNPRLESRMMASAPRTRAARPSTPASLPYASARASPSPSLPLPQLYEASSQPMS